jgi:predicted enzyme related to lactoylglutathione lyase
MMDKIHFILYVSDQGKSTEFYAAILEKSPALDVPGMTEFDLGPSTVLGLMPEAGIAGLLGPVMPHPSLAGGVPRSELYLVVPDAGAFHDRAIAAGASELSPLELRDWGHRVAYSQDPDGHVLAFASHGTES